jgi:hypothetical protein
VSHSSPQTRRGARIDPVEIPFALKPAPEIVTLEMLTLEPPELVIVTDSVLLLPTFTFPKPKDDALSSIGLPPAHWVRPNSPIRC